MSDLSDIKKVREHWYKAYFEGNTDILKQIEAADFCVTSPKGTKDRSSRYQSIKDAIDKGKWFNSQVIKEEDTLKFLLNDRKAKVSGHGRTLADGQALSEIQFEENWIKSKNGWQVKSLHVSKVS